LEKGNPLHLNNLESPSPKDDLYQVWLKFAQWFWRRSRKCKSLQTDRWTGGRQTKGDQKSSLELSAQAKNSLKKGLVTNIDINQVLSKTCISQNSVQCTNKY
jgi:hypothetical protein